MLLCSLSWWVSWLHFLISIFLSSLASSPASYYLLFLLCCWSKHMAAFLFPSLDAWNFLKWEQLMSVSYWKLKKINKSSVCEYINAIYRSHVHVCFPRNSFTAWMWKKLLCCLGWQKNFFIAFNCAAVPFYLKYKPANILTWQFLSSYIVCIGKLATSHSL